MKAVAGLIAAVLLMAILFAIYAVKDVPRPYRCAEAVQTAAISQRAAQICSTDLVGCSLSFEQLKQVIAEQEAAKGCE